MITLNEEEFIENALKNVSPYVDEIVIVDGGSKDRTVKIADQYGAKIVYSPWQEHYGRQRNISLKNASKEWILVMDPDEMYEEKLLKKLQQWTHNNIGVDMFAFPRKNYIDGVQTDAYPDRQYRFFLKKKAIRYYKRLHEVPRGWNMAASPARYHIIHSKSSKRQSRQNAHYKKVEQKWENNKAKDEQKLSHSTQKTG